MYSVSNEYRAAIAKPLITDRISGTITLTDGTVLPLSDKTLVKNSLKISHELCGDYRIGTFNLGCLQIAVFDDNALLRDFTDARICPVYEIRTEAGWESVPMGIYLADGNSARRKRNTVSLTAYDYGILFDKVIPAEKRTRSGTAATLIYYACEDCGVTFKGMTAAGLPNLSVRVSADNRQIQTYRDLIAWCATLLCGYAVIDRDGALWIRPAKYGVSDSDSSEILTDKLLTAAERNSIYVTDTRAYIKTLHAYSGKTLKTYLSDVEQPDEQAAAATYTLPELPILPESLDEQVLDQIYTDWLRYIDGFKQRGITAEIFGDPALDVGDVLRCSGGDIDQRRSIVGLVTKQEWRYRNLHTVICAAAQLSGKTTERSAAVGSQTGKQLSALSASRLSAGKGISIGDGKISLKPAKSGASDHLENLLGGVWIDGSGLRIDDDGRLTLRYARGEGAYGGIAIGSGLAITNSWYNTCSVNLGKGMRFNPLTDHEKKNMDRYGNSISPKLGDGLEFHPSEEEEDADYGRIRLNLGKGLAFGERKYEKKKDPEGNDTEEDDPTQYTSEVRLNLGEGLRFGANGELIAAGGKEYKAGENITISADGTISAESSGGAEIAAGGGIAIKTDEETGKQTVSALVGEGAELRDGKICTVPNIQNAVFLSEKDAKYLLHNFTEIEYIAGNPIGYAGALNQIVLQGFICYKTGGIAPNGVTIPNTNVASASDVAMLPNVPIYTEMNFSKPAVYSSNKYRKVKINPTYFYPNYYQFNLLGVTTENEEKPVISLTLSNYDHYSAGLALVWDFIIPPSANYEFGYANCKVFARCKMSATAYNLRMFINNLIVPFASLAEYQAAVGLTYEPLTLTRVEDNPTVVSGKEVN